MNFESAIFRWPADCQTSNASVIDVIARLFDIMIIYSGDVSTGAFVAQLPNFLLNLRFIIHIICRVPHLLACCLISFGFVTRDAILLMAHRVKTCALFRSPVKCSCNLLSALEYLQCNGPEDRRRRPVSRLTIRVSHKLTTASSSSLQVAGILWVRFAWVSRWMYSKYISLNVIEWPCSICSCSRCCQLIGLFVCMYSTFSEKWGLNLVAS